MFEGKELIERGVWVKTEKCLWCCGRVPVPPGPTPSPKVCTSWSLEPVAVLPRKWDFEDVIKDLEKGRLFWIIQVGSLKLQMFYKWKRERGSNQKRKCDDTNRAQSNVFAGLEDERGPWAWMCRQPLEAEKAIKSIQNHLQKETQPCQHHDFSLTKPISDFWHAEL